MSKNKIVFIIGLIVLLMPFFGFPGGLKDVLYIIAGLGLIVVSVSNRIGRGTVGMPAHKAESGPFDENSPVQR